MLVIQSKWKFYVAQTAICFSVTGRKTAIFISFAGWNFNSTRKMKPWRLSILKSAINSPVLYLTVSILVTLANFGHKLLLWGTFLSSSVFVCNCYYCIVIIIIIVVSTMQKKSKLVPLFVFSSSATTTWTHKIVAFYLRLAATWKVNGCSVR